jgi:glyoxylase-like metal-dependent hydrolase (beta-lactamase superfamily II)
MATIALLPPGVASQNARSGGTVTASSSIQAIRYAFAPDDVADLVMGAPKEKITLAMVVWLIRGGGRNILFDSDYHRDTFLKDFPSIEYIRPDEAVKLTGVQPDQITDVVISHAHWDHLGGIDLFPKARVWIQKEEFRYYTGEAWQPGGNHGGIDPLTFRNS